MASLSQPAGPSLVEEHPSKRARVLDLLDRHDADALFLTSQPALAWYLEGARVHVNAGAPPVVAVRVGAEADEVWLTGNEADRLVAEELPPWVSVVTFGWHEAFPLPAAGAGRGRELVEDDVTEEVRALRSPLLPVEIDRFAELGAAAAGLLTDVMMRARPEQTERSLAAEVSARVVALGADPLVVLVGGSSRVAYRHPLPSAAPLGHRAMVVLCARRHGLIVNLSRWVAFGPGSAAERDADLRILRVEAEFFAALADGRPLAEVFRLGCAGYGRYGFDAEEWQRHHQGGVAGYHGRDPRATPTVTDRVQRGQAFAWNPTAPGCKVEDTVLFDDNPAGGVRVLTADPRWPTVQVQGRLRPDVLTL